VTVACYCLRALWSAGGYTAQAVGLSMTSASHGAFTGTFTVLAVPMLVGLSGRRIATKTWLAGAAALIGELLFCRHLDVL
jgi:hypothetical protein